MDVNNQYSSVCPLCQSEVRPFFINLNEKILMCENKTCEYPFGHEEVQFLKAYPEIPYHDEIFTIDGSPTATASLISAAAWSEIDKLTQMCETEDGNFDLISLKHIQKETENDLRKKKDKAMKTDIDDLKKMNKLLFDDEKAKAEVVTITKEKWIKTLKNMQQYTAVSMLKPKEISLLKKVEPILGLDELKIDIDQSISSIKIEIRNNTQPTNENQEAEDE